MESRKFVKITPEIIEQACDYIPMLEKHNMAEQIAQQCVHRVKMTMLDNNGNRKAIPDRFQEAQLFTNLYMMGILAKLYLMIPYDGDSDKKDDNPYYGLQMPLNTYDQFAGSHVLNQLEQLKSDKSCKDKVYNILYDYRKLQRMINGEIETILGHQNDVVWRLLDALEVDAKEAALAALNEEHTENETPQTPEDKIADAKEKLEQFRQVKEQMDVTYAKLHSKLMRMEADASKGDKDA